MILGKHAILNEIKSGRIHIKSDMPVRVNPNSVNVRLGPDMFQTLTPDGVIRSVHTETPHRKIESVDWATLLLELEKRGCREELEEIKQHDHRYFILEPGRLYIGSTYEEIGTTEGSGLTTEMKARSSAGRIGLTVALCAGVGDIGYKSKWALEIRIPYPGPPLVVAVGTEVGQVVFHRVEGASDDYKGRYQDERGAVFTPKPLALPDREEKGIEIIPDLIIV